MRGSAPFFWSQDTIQGRITPKPQILVDRADPYFSATATHFNQLLSRYGSPIIILNLVKIKEKKPHEQILSGLLKESVEYLNQFLPPQHAMLYKAWDMARVTKCKEQKVIEILAEIAEQVMKETGFFQSGPQIFCNELRNHPSFAGMKGHGYSDDNPGLLQTGILRVNCVDCLDRTNATQFMVGKCALGFQLYALGVVESPILQFDSDALRMLEELFEAHGDTLALQYGGSQMVHRIRTYRKIAPWTSYSRDIMQTVSRYYSNAFTDTDKQQAINLFLGTFQPYGNNYHIWDIPTDYYLHHSSTINLDSHSVRPSYTKWWHDDVMNALPFSWEEKAKRELIETDEIRDDDDESMDLFSEYYRPAELTEFENMFCKNMPTSIKDFMPGSSGDPSPFVVRARGRSHGEASPTAHRHQIGGQPVAIDDSSDDDDVSSDEDRDVYSPFKAGGREALAPGDSNDNWPAFTNLYGINVVEPGTNDKLQYQRYAEISQLSTPSSNKSNSNYNVSWPCVSTFSNDCTLEVKLPTVDSSSQSLYSDYCKIGQIGPSAPNNFDLDIYQSYIRQNYM